MADAERDKQIDERWTAKMKAEFNPQYRPEHGFSAEQRMVNAAEYSAYQLGEIRKALQGINESLAKIAAKR